MGMFKKGGGAQQQKKKIPNFSPGKQYSVDAGSSELGVEQAHTTGSDSRTRLSGKGDSKKASLGKGQGARIKGRSDQKRRAAASVGLEKTIIGSSGDKLGA
jgi:hypothetical protein